MDISLLKQISEHKWEIPMHGAMRVPAVIYASEALLADMDSKVYEQAVNVAKLPGIVKAAYAMPDAHGGYGFPIGSIAAFDPQDGGVISAGGVGSDIACGVRCLHTGLTHGDLMGVQSGLADALYHRLPGVSRKGPMLLEPEEVDEMLVGGARWAVAHGWGEPEDLERIEEHGRIEGAEPAHVSEAARQRLRDEMGTLGSGNHYIEVQEVSTLLDKALAHSFGLKRGDIVLMIHCGSRGLGHQVGMELIEQMAAAAADLDMRPPERELASAPIESDLGQRCLGAMRAAGNFALANRQILTHLVREIFADVLPQARLSLLYDVSHNTLRVEGHRLDDTTRPLHVHRKGAARALGPGHPDLPDALRHAGQPVLIGGSMGASSYILAGTGLSESLAFSSACHGAGRTVSRPQAHRRWDGRKVVMDLAARGIAVRGPSLQGVAEEAPAAYQDVGAVVDAADAACLARKVARLDPRVCIKG
jgi:tRNA-splicing ligase RtcB